MQDLAYLFSIGFSGSDLVRALWLGLIASLFASRKLRAWKVTIFAFLIDQLWPFFAMRMAGAEMDIVWSSAAATVLSVPENAAYYVIRYLGFMGLIYAGYHIRRFLHHGRPDGDASAYPY